MDRVISHHPPRGSLLVKRRYITSLIRSAAFPVNELHNLNTLIQPVSGMMFKTGLKRPGNLVLSRAQDFYEDHPSAGFMQISQNPFEIGQRAFCFTEMSRTGKSAQPLLVFAEREKENPPAVLEKFPEKRGCSGYVRCNLGQDGLPMAFHAQFLKRSRRKRFNFEFKHFAKTSMTLFLEKYILRP